MVGDRGSRCDQWPEAHRWEVLGGVEVRYPEDGATLERLTEFSFGQARGFSVGLGLGDLHAVALGGIDHWAGERAVDYGVFSGLGNRLSQEDKAQVADSFCAAGFNTPVS